uniref:Uncharacterized protein n=1 Tax=Cannabis sativa TaxID=3483 RepID=A0A803PJT5_CANSA
MWKKETIVLNLKSWNEICQRKRCGELGIRRFKDMNLAFLSKLFLMVLKEEEKAWNKRLILECLDEEIAADILKIKPLLEGSNILFWKAAKLACTFEILLKWHNDLIFKERQCDKNLGYKDCISRAAKFLSNRLWFDLDEVDTKMQVLDNHSEEDYWCCNVDASVVGKTAGFAIFHKHDQVLEDSWVSMGFSSVDDVLEAKLCGISLALQTALEKEVPKVRIETDSKSIALAFAGCSLPYI